MQNICVGWNMRACKHGAVGSSSRNNMRFNGGELGHDQCDALIVLIIVALPIDSK